MLAQHPRRVYGKERWLWRTDGYEGWDNVWRGERGEGGEGGMGHLATTMFASRMIVLQPTVLGFRLGFASRGVNLCGTVVLVGRVVLVSWLGLYRGWVCIVDGSGQYCGWVRIVSGGVGGSEYSCSCRKGDQLRTQRTERERRRLPNWRLLWPLADKKRWDPAGSHGGGRGRGESGEW